MHGMFAAVYLLAVGLDRSPRRPAREEAALPPIREGVWAQWARAVEPPAPTLPTGSRVARATQAVEARRVRS